MNLSASPSSRILSGSIRALAHVLAGLQSLGVIVLFQTVALGNSLPRVALDSFPAWTLFASAVVLVAYLLGLIVDGLATTVWAAWVRQGWGRGEPKVWARVRTDFGLLDEYDEDPLKPWLAAQRWIWESPRAKQEFGDLRLRMMLGKDTALNVAAAVVICAASMFILPIRAALEGGSLNAGVCQGTTGDDWLLLATLSFATGLAVTCAQLKILEVPGFEARKRLRRQGKIGPNLSLFAAVLLGSVAFFRWWYLQHSAGASLFGCLEWLAPATALGPLLFFGFVYVRLDANALYHRMVRDATEAGPPCACNPDLEASRRSDQEKGW